MAVLVLGGAGYIGSHTVHALVERGADVVVADNLETGHRQAVHPEARFRMGDIRDESFLDDLFRDEEVEAVIHFAANSQVGESMVEPLKYYDNNVCGTTALLRAMLRNGVHKIVFSSTAATYGNPRDIPILESDPTVPTSTYGETKLAVEKMFKWTALASPLRYVSLRYFNACGALPDGSIGEDHRPESHLIPIVLQVASGRRASVGIFGDDYDTPDGTCVRDYIHVVDLAKAHIAAVDYLSNGGDSNVFNLGNGVGFSVREVVDCCRRVTGHAIPADILARRPGDPAQLVASNARAREILGFIPEFAALEDIVASAWKWHQTHPNGYGEA